MHQVAIFKTRKGMFYNQNVHFLCFDVHIYIIIQVDVHFFVVSICIFFYFFCEFLYMCILLLFHTNHFVFSFLNCQVTFNVQFLCFWCSTFLFLLNMLMYICAIIIFCNCMLICQVKMCICLSGLNFRQMLNVQLLHMFNTHVKCVFMYIFNSIWVNVLMRFCNQSNVLIRYVHHHSIFCWCVLFVSCQMC